MESRAYDRDLLREFSRWLGEKYECGSLSQLELDPVLDRFIAEQEAAVREAGSSDRYRLWKLHPVSFLAVRCDERGFWNGLPVTVISPSMRLEESKAVKDGEECGLPRWEPGP